MISKYAGTRNNIRVVWVSPMSFKTVTPRIWEMGCWEKGERGQLDRWTIWRGWSVTNGWMAWLS